MPVDGRRRIAGRIFTNAATSGTTQLLTWKPSSTTGSPDKVPVMYHVGLDHRELTGILDGRDCWIDGERSGWSFTGVGDGKEGR